MSKRKILSIAVITIVMLYIICVSFIFDLSQSRLAAGYTVQFNVENFEKIEYLNPLNDEIIEASPDDIAYVVSSSIQNSENYPFIVSVIDFEGNILAQEQYDNNKDNEKIYTYLKEDAQAYAGSFSNISSGGGAFSGSDEFYYTRTIFLNDSLPCRIYINSKIDLRALTFKNDSFLTNIESLTVIFVLVGSSVILSLAYVITKNERMQKAKYAFTNAAAHELKTPLAVIENQCECVLENVNAEKNIDYVKSIYEESIRMTQLVNSLLQYNKLSFTDKIEKKKVSLADIVTEEVEKYLAFAQSKGQKMKIDINTKAYVRCNPQLIALAIDNYISNAVKYSEKNTEIQITLKHNYINRYKLTVFNVCDGINSKKIWDVLYQSNKARSDKSTGMGLAINKTIFELHNFKYGYKNVNNGVEFYFITK